MNSPPYQQTAAPWGDRAPYAPRLIGGKRALAAEAPWRLVTGPWFPDTVLDAGRVGDIAVRAAATRGPSHRYYGTTREDAAAVVNIADRFVAAAVADGVGSVAGSDRAAHDAVQVCLRRLHQSLVAGPGMDGDRLRDAIGAVQAELLDRPGLDGKAATTLTVAVLAAVPAPDGTYQLWVGRVGDSPAYTLVDGDFEEIFRAGAAAPGELHTTVTDGLPAPSLPDAMVLSGGRLNPGQALVLATDGLGTPLRFGEVREHLADAWRAPGPEPIEFLTQLQFRRRSYDDDRSAVVMWTPPQHGGSRSDPPWRFPQDVRFLRHRMLLPDSMLDAGRAGELEIRAASTRGGRRRLLGASRHQAAGAVTGEDRIVAALAEGTRSLVGFHVGCLHAVQQALAELRTVPSRGSVSTEVVAAMLDLDRELSLFGAAPADKATTLSIAVVDREPGTEGGHAYTVVRVGRSPAYQLTDAGCRPLFGDANPAAMAALLAGEPAPTTATTLVRSGRLHPGDALVLAAESLDPDLRGELGEGLLRAIPGPTEFLHVLQDARQTGDDRSAVAVWVSRGDR